MECSATRRNVLRDSAGGTDIARFCQIKRHLGQRWRHLLSRPAPRLQEPRRGGAGYSLAMARVMVWSRAGIRTQCDHRPDDRSDLPRTGGGASLLKRTVCQQSTHAYWRARRTQWMRAAMIWLHSPAMHVWADSHGRHWSPELRASLQHLPDPPQTAPSLACRRQGSQDVAARRPRRRSYGSSRNIAASRLTKQHQRRQCCPTAVATSQGRWAGKAERPNSVKTAE